MMLFDGMHYFVLVLILITSVCSWPMFEDENGPDLDLALSSQPTDVSTNNSMITDHTIKVSKIVNTTLGCVAFLFTSIIYFFLMRYTLALSNEIILPSKFLAHNLSGILSSAWLAESYGPGEENPKPGVVQAWKLLLKPPVPVDRRFRQSSGMGYSDRRIPTRNGTSPQPEVLGFKTFSPVMRSLIQIAVWNSASFWILLISITNTLVYNGFFTNNITTDGIVRLLLVGSYAVANIAHQIRCTTLLYRNFSFLVFQASWTIVCNDFFILSTLGRSPVLMAFNTQLLGTTERSNAVRIPQHIAIQGGIEEGESRLDKFIKPQRETELKAYEKATDSALERTLANVAVLAGICLAAALAPWTSLQASSSMSAQLGSYALLLSISTGLLALVSSIGHLSNATESNRKLSQYQECAITSEYEKHELTSGYELSEHLHRPGSGFFSRQKDSTSYKVLSGKDRTRYPSQYPLTFWGHLRSIKGPRRLLGLFLGPALMLVPRLYGIRQPLNDAAGRFNFTVNELKFSYNSREASRIGRVDPTASCPPAKSEVPDQAGGSATGDDADMETGGQAHEEADELGD